VREHARVLTALGAEATLAPPDELASVDGLVIPAASRA
jgi:glutamine amidotransferase PdxT